ncbi:MAG: hypothetical protein ACOYJ1_03760 [Peptococcales bacterium]|jgi:hypothetical protein
MYRQMNMNNNMNHNMPMMGNNNNSMDHMMMHTILLQDIQNTVHMNNYLLMVIARRLGI